MLNRTSFPRMDSPCSWYVLVYKLLNVICWILKSVLGFHFYVVENVFLFSLWYLLWPMGYLEALFIFQIFRYFPDTLLSISSLHLFWWENRFYIISNIFSLSGHFLMTQDIVDLGKCSTCTWKECGFRCRWWSVLKIALGQVS